MMLSADLRITILDAASQDARTSTPYGPAWRQLSLPAGSWLAATALYDAWWLRCLAICDRSRYEKRRRVRQIRRRRPLRRAA